MTEKTPVQEAIETMEAAGVPLHVEFCEGIESRLNNKCIHLSVKDANNILTLLRTLQSGKGEAVEKIAPVQGFSAGIPWDMHLRAYDAYCKKYGSQKALIDLEGRNCRGGFSTHELDVFIPGWRDDLEQRRKDKAALTTPPEPVNSDKVDVELAQAYAELYEHAVECEIMSFEGSDRFGDIADRIATLGLLRSGV